MTRTTGRIALLLVATLIAMMAFTSCEDTLTPQLKEVVRVASLPDRMLTIQPSANGSVSPSGQQTVKESEPVGISATPNDGYTFLYWQKVSGDGTVAFEDENSANTTVTLSEGDAVIEAVIGNTPRSLTVTAGANGSVSPSGTVTVQDGVARNIIATPASSAYEFVDWEQTGGAGTVVFGSATAASTTVTVTDGDAEILGNFALKTYTIGISATTGGLTNSASVDVQHGVASATITATANPGYVFVNWTVTSGGGISFSPGATSTSIQITASGGDATIRANFLATYSLTMTSDPGGFTSPSGTVTVTSGVSRVVTAYPGSTYVFDGWEKVSGTGGVVFSDASSASTNVTVTDGNATILANFRKETVTLTEVGSYQHGNFSTTPEDAVDAYYTGGYLYLVGRRSATSSDGVVRRWNVSTPTAPTSGLSDYYYLTGIPSAIIGNGTNLFIGTSSTLYNVTIAGFDATPTVNSIAHGIRDLSLASTTSFYGVRTTGVIAGYYSSLSSGNMISDSIWGFDYITALPSGVGATMEDNGANQLGTYIASIGGTQGVTAPDDSVALHGGYDLDPGWAGKGVQDVDREFFIVPVEDENGIAKVSFYDITGMSSIYTDGSATLSKRANYLATDTSGENDYYVFAAAGFNDGATVYVIDMYSKANPVVRTTVNISGYNSADAIAVNGNYVYVVVDDPTSGTNPKPTVKVFEITKN